MEQLERRVLDFVVFGVDMDRHARLTPAFEQGREAFERLGNSLAHSRRREQRCEGARFDRDVHARQPTPGIALQQRLRTACRSIVTARWGFPPVAGSVQASYVPAP